MLFCGRPLRDAPTVCNSVFEPLLSIPSFHFPLRTPTEDLLWSLLLVIHHHHLLASFYSHSWDTCCHLWLLSHKGEKAGWQTRLETILLHSVSYLMHLWQRCKWVPKNVWMLLFSMPSINPHLSLCSNSGLPQPVNFADRLADRTREQDMLCVCVSECVSA